MGVGLDRGKSQPGPPVAVQNPALAAPGRMYSVTAAVRCKIMIRKLDR
jgi:hypothetical protein